MTTKQLGFKAPLSLAIAAGATTPDPGSPGVEVWSTTTSQKMVWSGSAWHVKASVTVGPTAPSNPATGDVWVDTN